MVRRITKKSERKVQQEGRSRVVFLEWIDPLFNSGQWIPEIISMAGGDDCLGEIGRPAKRISWSDVVAIDPDILVVSCCGYNIEQTQTDLLSLQKLPGWRYLRCVREKRAVVVDGNAYFSRPSLRLIDSLMIMFNIITQTSDHRYQLIGSHNG